MPGRNKVINTARENSRENHSICIRGQQRSIIATRCPFIGPEAVGQVHRSWSWLLPPGCSAGHPTPRTQRKRRSRGWPWSRPRTSTIVADGCSSLPATPSGPSCLAEIRRTTATPGVDSQSTRRTACGSSHNDGLVSTLTGWDQLLSVWLCSSIRPLTEHSAYSSRAPQEA